MIYGPYILVVTLSILQCLDWYTTHKILNAGGTELNPIMVKLFAKLGMDVTLGLKVVMVTAIAYYIAVTLWYVLIPLNLFYCWVIYNNWKSL